MKKNGTLYLILVKLRVHVALRCSSKVLQGSATVASALPNYESSVQRIEKIDVRDQQFGTLMTYSDIEWLSSYETIKSEHVLCFDRKSIVREV
jgi:hypothetical protein